MYCHIVSSFHGVGEFWLGAIWYRVKRKGK